MRCSQGRDVENATSLARDVARNATSPARDAAKDAMPLRMRCRQGCGAAKNTRRPQIDCLKAPR